MKLYLSLSTLLLTSLALSLLAGCSASERAIKISELDGDAESGMTLYSDKCSSCHGASARGKVGPDLISHLADHDEADFIDIIINGEGGMPSFKSLEDQEIADIIAHLQSL